MANVELFIHRPEAKSTQEECGIVGVFSKKGNPISHEVPAMNQELGNRGRDTSGIAVYVDGNLNLHNGPGLPHQVFPENFDYGERGLVGRVAIGHNRYATTLGVHKDDLDGAQPMVAQWQGRKVAIAYNGNLPNSERQKLKDKIPSTIPESRFDTEDILNAIVTADGDTWEERIVNALKGIELAYSLTILTDQGELFGLRGPSGTWPLWIGENGDEIIFASETTVSTDTSLKWSEVKPGELVKATTEGVDRKTVFEPKITARCALNDVYGARRKGQMTEEGLTYYDFSVKLGGILAEEHPIEADLYVGLPNSGLPVAEGYALGMGSHSSELITANGLRSFIAQNGSETMRIINGKYSIEHPELINGRSVVVLDDTAIKGATLGGDPDNNTLGVVGLLRKAGARKVDIGLIMPKFTEGCDMGYYIVRDTLVAVLKMPDGSYETLNDKQIAEKIGADSIFFLSVEGVRKGYEEFGLKEKPCMTCVGQPHPLEIIGSKKPDKEAVFVG